MVRIQQPPSSGFVVPHQNCCQHRGDPPPPTQSLHLVQRSHWKQTPGKSISCPSSLQNHNTKGAQEEDNGFWQPPIESSWFYCQRSPSGAAPCGGVKHVTHQDCASRLKSLIITGSVTVTAGPGLRSLVAEKTGTHTTSQTRTNLARFVNPVRTI